MNDRVSLYPGRVTLTPVSGQANTFDLVRADQPTQDGTPLNKASLLKDTTAALFGKTNAAVPDDILSLLSKSVIAQGTKITDVLGNLIAIPADQIKDGVKLATGSYTGTGKYGTTNKSKLTFPFKPSLVLIFHPADSNYQAVCLPGSDGSARPFGANTPSLYATWSGNTVSWYSTDSDRYQFNSKNEVYYYLAV